MAVKLINLQLIYGVAGAREKFEELAAQLVKAEQPAADKVRINRGDSGIDVHVGELTDPCGIDVYQCKFFPQGVEESQKDQIRDSFKRCRESTKFKLKKWVLCLPVDLSVDEKRWFEDWRARQASSGVEIEDVWGATKLESLLYQEKNRGLKEEFFNEKQLTQSAGGRQLHGLYSELVGFAVSEFKRAQSEEATIQLELPGYRQEVVKLQQRRQCLCLDLRRISSQIRLLETDDSLRCKVEQIAEAQPWMPPNWGQQNYSQQLAKFKEDIATFENLLENLIDKVREVHSRN